MSRRDIYYWKCDRPAAFFRTQERHGVDTRLEQQVLAELHRHFAGQKVSLQAAATQGNHLTWNAEIDGRPAFIRVEDGPEGDPHLEMESAVMGLVRATGVPVPQVLGVDATRRHASFAWQAQQRVAFPDLNHWHKQGRLNVQRMAFDIGAAVARWQTVAVSGFGPFDLERWREGGRLAGFHARYEDYFRLRLEEHLDFLTRRQFLSPTQRDEIARAFTARHDLLAVGQPCLVHKDLALWNILGSETQIAAYIDWDDAIAGDAMDDFALLACFHDGPTVDHALAGYASVRPLPSDYRGRFWLHLLRNMVVKAVIRVGAGYFDRTDRFFLIGAGDSGADLKAFTYARLDAALDGLRNERGISTL